MVRQQQMAATSAAPGNVDVSRIPTLKPAAPMPPKLSEPTIVRPVKIARPEQKTQGASASQRALTDTQVLKIVEKRRASTSSTGAEAAGSSSVAVLLPEDTNTRLALREAVARNAPVSFAVQLQWSVQPIDIRTLSPHPLFRAYSLYVAEGRRAERTWFFIRLGFFSDAMAAKQVADYLRGDFASAAVVPVSPQEQQQVTQKGLCTEACTLARRPA
jgi:hypothetical protein